VRPSAAREVGFLGFLMDTLGLSERRGCQIVGLSGSVQQYRPAPKNDVAVVGRLKELASEIRRGLATRGWHRDGGGLRAAELRSGRGLPVRLEP
jgi:hypothetical protein